jgi:hypothetical protein
MSPQSSLFPQEEPYLEGLPKAGSMRSGYLFERPMWERRTGGSEYSSSLGADSWPTPDANVMNDGESVETFESRRKRNIEKHANGNGMGTPLAMKATSWKTPHGMSGIDHAGKVGNGNMGPNLRDLLANWPSPRSEDAESCGNHPGVVDSLGGASELWTTPQVHDTHPGKSDRVGRFGTEAGGANLTDDVMLWSTPNVPNGGRALSPEITVARGSTEGGKRSTTRPLYGEATNDRQC